MSHGTGSYYVVVSPEELRRRALAEQRRRCSVLSEQLAGLMAEANALGAQAPAEARAPSGDNLERWTAHVNDLAAQLAITRAAIQQAQRATWAAEINKHLAGIAGGITLDIRPTESASDIAPHRTGSRSPVDELKSSLEVTLAQAAFITNTQARSRLVTIAEDALRLLSNDLTAARGRLAILRNQVHKDLAEQARQEKLQAKVQELLLDASGLPPAANARISAMASSARTAADLPAIQAKIEYERKRAEAQEDRRIAIREVAAALTRMGYEVGEEFTDALTAGRTMIVEPPDLPGYGIELDVQDGRGRLLTETIALTAESRGDLAAQAAGCTAVDQLSAELAVAGIRLDRYHTAMPGQMPMQREVREEVKAQEVARRRRRSIQQERHL